MAKNSRRRDNSYIARRSLPVSAPKNTYPYVRYPSLTVFEDRRRWYPEPRTEPARSFTSPRSRFTVLDRVSHPRTSARVDASRSLPSQWSQTRATIAFAEPRSTLICVRRQQRREVLHALERTRQGGSGGSKSRWSEWSNVRCR